MNKNEEIQYGGIIEEEGIMESVPIHEMVMDAYNEAVKRGIKANTIIINKNLVEVKPFTVNDGFGFSELPPMICGMQAFFTDKELPDDYAFSVLEAKCTEREFLIQQTRENSVREFAKILKEKVLNFCGTEEENAYYDVSKEEACEEIDETLKEFIGESK